MAQSQAAKRRLGSFLVAAACLAVAGTAAWSIFAKHPPVEAAGMESTAAIDKSADKLGPSGLPLPRFVSLKAEKVNVRRGPSSDYPVAWVFQRKGLPVEIVAEFENWRRIRDSDGAEGWILQNMLSGKRTVTMMPRKATAEVPLRQAASRDAGLIAKVAAGVVADVEKCSGNWCEISAGGYDGFVEQASLWGVYPNEKVD